MRVTPHCPTFLEHDAFTAGGGVQDAPHGRALGQNQATWRYVKLTSHQLALREVF